jgi:transcriptional regulator with XRE-family HTH domain
MISRVEHEQRRPTLDTLLRITEAMEIDLWPLLKIAEQKAGHDFKSPSPRFPQS